MVVYKNFLKLVWTKKSMVIMYSAIFLLTSFMFSSGSKNTETEFSEKSLYLQIVDKDNSELSRNLIQYLKTKNRVSENINLQNAFDEEVLQSMKKEISLGNIDAGIIIQKDMEKRIADGKICVNSFKDDRRQSAFYIDMQIQKFLLFANTLKKAEGKIDFEKLQTALSENTPVQKIASKKASAAGEWFKYFFNVFAWFSFSLVLNIVGWTLFLLRQPTIKMRNAVSPVSSLRFSLENFAAQLTVVAGILVGIIGVIVLVKRSELAGVPILVYTLNSVIYIAVVLSIAFLLNTVLKKSSVLGIVGTVLPLALAFISGAFMPQEFISPSVLRIAKFFPTYYFIQANENTFSFLVIDWKNIGMLCVFLVAYVVAGIVLTARKRSEHSIEKEQE